MTRTALALPTLALALLAAGPPPALAAGIAEAAAAPATEAGFVLRRGEAGKPAAPGRGSPREAASGALSGGLSSSRHLLGGLGWLGAVLLGIVLLGWLVRRFAPGALAAFRSPALEVLGRTVLDRGRSVWLLRVGERVIAVGCSNAGIERLAEIADPEEAARLCRSARGASAARGGAERAWPLELLRGRRSFQRSLEEAARFESAAEEKRGEPPAGSRAERRPEDAAENLRGEALRMKRQLEAMRKVL